MDCVFCEIEKGNLPASFVYKNENVFALMSLEQPNPYKVLVVPRTHVEMIYDLDNELAASIFQTTVKIAKAVREVSGCDGLNLVQSNGRAGQQDVLHFHLHIVPRFYGDEIILQWENAVENRNILDQYAKDIQKRMAL